MDKLNYNITALYSNCDLYAVVILIAVGLNDSGYLRPVSS